MRGELGVRPWGTVLSSLAHKRFTGQLRVVCDEAKLAITLEGGQVVDAVSPFPADTVPRIAVAAKFVAARQAGALARRITPLGGDEIDAVADAAELTPDQAELLRAQVVRQRAARSFELERGTYVATEAQPARPQTAVEMRSVIYFGARRCASDLRLATELRQLGAVKLDRRALTQLHQFGFTAEERPILESLREGASVAELDAIHHDIDPRMVQAVVYALASFYAATQPPPVPKGRPLQRAKTRSQLQIAPPRSPASPTAPPSRTRTRSGPLVTPRTPGRS